MKIEIIRARKRNISMRMVDSSHIIVRAPLKMPLKEIENFVESKKMWISKGSAKLRKKEEFSKSFDFSKFVYLDGQEVGLIENIIPNYAKLSENSKKRAVKKFYLSHFYKLEKITEEIAQKFGLKYAQLKPTTSVRVWGSLNSNKIMKLNWKLVIVPEKLAIYVICHELSHSVYFNHSPRFWAFLEKICPQSKTLKKELDSYAFLLRGNANI